MRLIVAVGVLVGFMGLPLAAQDPEMEPQVL